MLWAPNPCLDKFYLTTHCPSYVNYLTTEVSVACLLWVLVFLLNKVELATERPSVVILRQKLCMNIRRKFWRKTETYEALYDRSFGEFTS